MSRAPMLDLLIGFALISAVTLIAHDLRRQDRGRSAALDAAWTGWLVIEWMAWTVGLGAALAAVLGSRQACHAAAASRTRRRRLASRSRERTSASSASTRASTVGQRYSRST